MSLLKRLRHDDLTEHLVSKDEFDEHMNEERIEREELEGRLEALTIDVENMARALPMPRRERSA